MSAVDLGVIEGIPVTGVYTSDQGAVRYQDLEVMKIADATLEVINNVGVYRETGRRTGTTYAGNVGVRGTITRALLNFGDARLATGFTVNEGKILPHGNADRPLVLDQTSLAALLAKVIGGGTEFFPYGDNIENFYPPFFDIEFEVNTGMVPKVSADGGGDIYNNARSAGKWQSILAKHCRIENYVIAFDNRGHVVSGPLSFIGSYAVWNMEGINP